MKLLATLLACAIVLVAAVSMPLLGHSGHVAGRIAVAVTILALAIGAGVALKERRRGA